MMRKLSPSMQDVLTALEHFEPDDRPISLQRLHKCCAGLYFKRGIALLNTLRSLERRGLVVSKQTTSSDGISVFLFDLAPKSDNVVDA